MGYFLETLEIIESSRQGEVTLSSSEAEFVAVNQPGQEVVYLREL